jgi:hypothetical protein
MTWATYDGGDHEVVLGEVVALNLMQPAAPALVYFRRGFRELVDPGEPGDVA